MSEDKMKIQKKELGNVAGGQPQKDYYDIICGNCKYHFCSLYTEERSFKKNCSTWWVFKCPNCEAWVYPTGEVYELPKKGA